jgi:2-iminobutanoate/2-iminopropanoate deaminase
MSTPVGPYTPVVRAGDWVITSGQLGLKDGKLVEGGVAAETAQVMANIKALLATHGATMDQVVKTMCVLTDLSDFAAFNEAYVAGLGDNRPARSTFAGGLVLGASVEVEAWAYCRQEL